MAPLCIYQRCELFFSGTPTTHFTFCFCFFPNRFNPTPSPGQPEPMTVTLREGGGHSTIFFSHCTAPCYYFSNPKTAHVIRSRNFHALDNSGKTALFPAAHSLWAGDFIFHQEKLFRKKIRTAPHRDRKTSMDDEKSAAKQRNESDF